MTIDPKRKLNTGGFTLLESVVYVAILGLVFAMVVNTILVITRVVDDLKAGMSLNRSVLTAMEKMVNEITRAESIDTGLSSLGSHPGRLVLNVRNSQGELVKSDFYFEDGIIKFREDLSEKGGLISSGAAVENIIFHRLTPGASEAVRIEIGLTASSGRASKTESFYTTRVLRGSYIE